VPKTRKNCFFLYGLCDKRSIVVDPEKIDADVPTLLQIVVPFDQNSLNSTQRIVTVEQPEVSSLQGTATSMLQCGPLPKHRRGCDLVGERWKISHAPGFLIFSILTSLARRRESMDEALKKLPGWYTDGK
jgi:hypothetical protein